MCNANKGGVTLVTGTIKVSSPVKGVSSPVGTRGHATSYCMR